MWKFWMTKIIHIPMTQLLDIKYHLRIVLRCSMAQHDQFQSMQIKWKHIYDFEHFDLLHICLQHVFMVLAACCSLCSNYTSTISLCYSFHISKTNCSSIIIDTCRCVCTSMQRAAMRISMMINILILASLLILSFR